MNARDVVERIKDNANRIAVKAKCLLIDCNEWIYPLKGKIKRRLSKYYAYYEVLIILDDATGMYAKFVESWHAPQYLQSDLLFSDGAKRPSKEVYYKDLIQILPIKSEYDKNNDASIIEGWERACSPFRICIDKKYMDDKQREINNRKFLKKSVNGYLKEQKKIQDRGDQPKLINFYDDDMDYINKLSQQRAGTVLDEKVEQWRKEEQEQQR